MPIIEMTSDPIETKTKSKAKMKMQFTSEQREQIDKSLSEFRKILSDDPSKFSLEQPSKPFSDDEIKERFELLRSANKKSSKLSNRSFVVSVVSCIFAGAALFISIVSLFL